MQYQWQNQYSLLVSLYLLLFVSLFLSLPTTCLSYVFTQGVSGPRLDEDGQEWTNSLHHEDQPTFQWCQCKKTLHFLLKLIICSILFIVIQYITFSHSLYIDEQLGSLTDHEPHRCGLQVELHREMGGCSWYLPLSEQLQRCTGDHLCPEPQCHLQTEKNLG